MEWLDGIVAATVAACLEAADEDAADMAADSTSVETDRYEKKTKLDRKTGKESDARVQTYLKWRILAAVGIQVILSCATTPSSVADTDTLRTLLEKSKKTGRSFAGWTLHADKGRDSDQNCEAVFKMGMRPNIAQRKSEKNSGDRRNVGKPSRRRAGEMFDPARYPKRKMVEGIFGTEESSNHRLHCRFRKKGTQERFGPLLAITWNARTLNRILHRAEKTAEKAAAPAAA